MAKKTENTTSYYKDNLPHLIADLKVAVENNREVIKQPVKGDLSEDRYVNVLKSRRMAAEDTIYFLRQIDILEAELNGTEAPNDSKQANSTPKSWAKRMAEQKEK